MVSIIIVSFNTRELLKSCLESIYTNLRNFEFEIIVVDNMSRDGTVEMIKKEFTKARLIQNKTNVGFAKGCNIGGENAKGEYLLFLNSDTQIKDDTIKNMLVVLEQNKEIGVIGGELQNIDDTTSESYGSFYSIKSIISLLFLSFLKKKKVLSEKSIVDWVSGGFMLIKAPVFKKLNGFDERFFMYVEDMELCFRVIKLGYSTMFFPQAKAFHQGQGSSDRSFAIVNIFKGILYFYRKHKTYPEYILIRMLLTIKAISVMIIGILTFNKKLVLTYQKALVF